MAIVQYMMTNQNPFSSVLAAFVCMIKLKAKNYSIVIILRGQLHYFLLGYQAQKNQYYSQASFLLIFLFAKLFLIIFQCLPKSPPRYKVAL